MKLIRLPFMKWIMILAITSFVSCKKDAKNETYDLGYDYFPIDSGWVRTYSVDSISYNDNTQSIDTFHFILKEINSGIIQGHTLSGHLEILRLVQPDSSLFFVPRNSCYVLQTENNLQRVDENIRTVKLIFPIGNIKTWDGNLLNGNGKKTFQLQSNSTNFNNGDTLFANCATVIEAQASNVIENILIKSVYCKGLGLVDFTNNYTNTQVSGISGYKVHQKLISFSRP